MNICIHTWMYVYTYILRCAAVCCSVLQCVLQCAAVCCSVLQCVLQCAAVCCSVWQCVQTPQIWQPLCVDDRRPRCVEVCCHVLQWTLQSVAVCAVVCCSVHCSVLQCALQCVAVCTAVCCSDLQWVAVSCSVLQRVPTPQFRQPLIADRQLVCCSVLQQCVAVYAAAVCCSVCCSLLHCFAVYINASISAASNCRSPILGVLQYFAMCVAVCCSVLQCVAVCCSVYRRLSFVSM